MEMLREEDPEGVKQRAKGRLKRRIYLNKVVKEYVGLFITLIKI